MLRFSQKPDEVMNEVITRALNTAITDLKEDIDLMIPVSGEADFTNNYFTEQDQLLLGGTEGILYELRRIKSAHNSKTIYMPSDLHFLIIDRILSVWCEIYGDVVSESIEDYPVMYHNKPVMNIECDYILDYYWWDTDYDLPLQTGMVLRDNKETKELYGISDEAINASLNIPADTNDLTFKIIEVTKEWHNPEPMDWHNEEEID